MKLLDSSILIDYARNRSAAQEYLEAHDDAVFGAPTIVLSELYTGLFLTTDMDREAVLAKYGWLRSVPFTNEAAVEAAEINATLRSRGTSINESDIYIAGTARAFDVTLVTGDSDFESVDRLTVEQYHTKR